METLLFILERLVFWEQTFCVFCKLFVIYIWIDLCSPEYLIVWWLLNLLFDIHYLFGLLSIYIWKSLNYFMVFKPVHVFSYICYLIWAPPWGPSRYQVHSRITYIIICIRTPALILRWRRSVYLLGRALTFFWPLVMWTIITRSTVPSVLFCIFYYLNWIYNIWYELNENYYCEIVHASVCSLPLCIIIIIHWAILAQPTFLLFLFQISRFFSVASPAYQFLQRSHLIHFYHF